jgi:spore coat polysaccharide biosynthesis predicted glycosyltransferase SpsG
MAQQTAEWVVDLSNPNADKITSDSTTNVSISNKQSMTAVEWFVKQLPIRIVNSYQEEIAKAKQVEKHHIAMAYEWGWVNGDLKKAPSRGSDYYNQTFKNEDND